MSGLILWLTVAILPLPVVLLFAASSTGGGPAATLPALLVATIYLGVWLYMRPSWFELSGDGGGHFTLHIEAGRVAGRRWPTLIP